MEHRTGLEMYCTIDEKNNILRYGYTTGSCAAAAAQAAARMLLTGEKVEEVALETPKGILLHLLIEDIRMNTDEVICAVRKDGGDDPDVTHGILVYARVKKTFGKEVSIDGGIGVGRVTRPGLTQPPGAAAINDTPRKMIRENVEAVCKEYGFDGGMDVMIEIPAGVELAKKTFNPRLGIEGGISVLGTSGIVVPMSEAALVASIKLEMQMLVKAGAEYLVITPGNYGQVFSENQIQVDLTYSMKCSNYVGETLDMARDMGVKGILFIAHIGKFIKTAGGIMNTHSRNADSRAELMAANALRAGAGYETVMKILNSITTEESVDILIKDHMLKKTMQQIEEKVDYYLNKRSGENLQVGAILFSNVYGELGRTRLADELLDEINRR
ncbi:cobalt-precorrin-5B (C(1))-methyltransferase CbiD [bacterium]|nr:cobalt-precorrin-5B (C(1))-methyltransferase CbiD [bacterium]MDY3021286.1 cobalt-precorrin-5B (C(1))-methyltransferase CbiD [Oliverpabstia sp.]